MLINVELFELLNSNTLNLDRISIIKPEIVLTLAGPSPVLFPFKDSTFAVPDSEVRKKFLDSFRLNEFQLVNASFHVTNSGKEREFNISDFHIVLKDLLITQVTGEYQTAFKQVDVSIGELRGRLQRGPISQVSLKDYSLKIDSLRIQKTLDTLVFHFSDFTTGLHTLDVQTADSLFHLTTQSFNLSYKNKVIQVKEASFMPNVSYAVLQRDQKFQHAEFSGSAGFLEFTGVNFDSLIYARKLFINEITLNRINAFVFKDKTKPLDKKRFPAYLGQTVRKIPLPVRINHIKATGVRLENTERKPDSTMAMVNITKATLDITNVTNQGAGDKLVMQADAFINDKARFRVHLSFYYAKPQFDFEGVVDEFNLPDLNPLLQAYTPAIINKGIADKITFSGVAKEKGATGTMEFLYHGLEVDLTLKEQAGWANSLLTFAANTATDSSNPGSPDVPSRVVAFNIKRDMNKGFVMVIIRSILEGLKETMVMSKENRKAYSERKKKAKMSE